MHFVTTALVLHLLKFSYLLTDDEWTLHDFNIILVSEPNMACIVVKWISAHFPKFKCENSTPLPVFVVSKVMCKTQIRKRHKRSSGKSNYEPINQADKKHLITGPQEKQWVLFSQDHETLFPVGRVMKCFVIPPNWKIEKSGEKTYLLDACRHNKFASVSRCTTWPRASRKYKLFLPQGVGEFWPTTRDTFSNREV